MTYLQFPVLLVGRKPSSVELLERPSLLKYIFKSIIEKGKLIDVYVYDCNGSCFCIKKIESLGRKNPWWHFDLRDPLLKVNIEYEMVNQTLGEMKANILDGVRDCLEFWEDYEPFEMIEQNVNAALSLKAIIQYLNSLIYRKNS